MKLVIPRVAVVAALFATTGAATAVTITENFDPFSGALTLNKTDDPLVGFVADPFVPANGNGVEITMQGGDEAVLLTADLGTGTFFSVSTRIVATDSGQLEIDFSNGGFGVTAAGSANDGDTLENNPFLADTADSGYKLLIQSNFTDNEQRLVLRQAGVDLASVDIATDLTDTFDQYSVQLTLTGTTQPNGDVELVGTLFDTLGSGDDDSTMVAATVAAANVEIGTDYGIAQLLYGSGNPSRAIYDNVEITVVPEPTAAVIVAAGLATLLGARRRGSLAD